MKRTRHFLLLAMSAILTNPAAAQSNTITVSWSAVQPNAVPTLGAYATIALTILLAIIAFRVIKTRPGAVKYLVVAALSITVLATAVMIPPVIASSPVTIPISSGCESGSATYPDDDDSVEFYNQCDVVMQIQLNFDNARCNESEAIIEEEDSLRLSSGDLVEPTGEERRLAYCSLR
jgi:hypothetical protein